MNNAEAQTKAQEWHGQAGGRLCPQLTENELAGLVNEAIGSTPPVNVRELHADQLQAMDKVRLAYDMAKTLKLIELMGVLADAINKVQGCVYATGYVLRNATQPIRPGDVMRLNLNACPTYMAEKYLPETLFHCVGSDDELIKARSHFGTPKPGPVLLWPFPEKWFEVIGHVALPAEGAPT
jgi:hypothetical protein